MHIDKKIKILLMLNPKLYIILIIIYAESIIKNASEIQLKTKVQRIQYSK